MSDPMSGAVRAELAYPRVEGNADAVIVSLLDVRAADNLVIRYDFARDGWSIALEEDASHERAFVPAWAEEGRAGESIELLTEVERLRAALTRVTDDSEGWIAHEVGYHIRTAAALGYGKAEGGSGLTELDVSIAQTGILSRIRAVAAGEQV